MCVITLHVMKVRLWSQNKYSRGHVLHFPPPSTYSLMAILSECRDDTDDML